MNKKWRIIVFGDLPIATKVCEWIRDNNELDLVGCVLSNPNAHNNDPWPETPMLGDYCRMNKIPLYSIEEMNKSFDLKDLDLGLVCRFSKIIKRETIDLFKIGLINMHGGLLPEYAGPYSANYSVLFGEKKGGGTLHWIDEGIDTGDIIRRCEIEIGESDTGYTVFQKTQIALYENMIEIIMPILRGDIKEFIDQKKLIEHGYPHRYFDLKSIKDYKKIDFNDDIDKIDRQIRAFDFPGYEPAYFIGKDGKKVFARTSI